MDAKQKQLNRLKEILAIPTFFKKEHEVLRYLVKFLRTTKYEFTIDTFGNLYITKGKKNWYPLVCAHTDSVHKHTDIEIHEVTYDNTLRLIGKHATTNLQCGIGADDKAGVFVCLELLDALPALKVVLFASEEYGCVGSQNVDPEFFKNVGYVIEFDCPGSSDVTHYCNGIQLFDVNGRFFDKIEAVLQDKIPKAVILHHHPYTDVWCLKRKFDISCINIATGYHFYHTDSEYVVVDEVLNAIDIGFAAIKSLGCRKYKFTPPLKEITKYDTIVEMFKRQYPKYFAEKDDYMKILTEVL